MFVHRAFTGGFMSATLALAHLECVVCGTSVRFAVRGVESGFFETGWSVQSVSNDIPLFRCEKCSAAGRRFPLKRQKDYLAHVIEAQQRFSE